MNKNSESSSFGMELIELLTKQLKGKLEKESSSNGCTFTLTFNTIRS
jgi:two-component sensor histidine kinase